MSLVVSVRLSDTGSQPMLLQVDSGSDGPILYATSSALVQPLLNRARPQGLEVGDARRAFAVVALQDMTLVAYSRKETNHLRNFEVVFYCRVYFVHSSGVEAAHMRKRNRRPPCRKIVLKLPDLDHAKSAVVKSLRSPHSRRNYKFAMEQFITWYCSEPRLALNRAVVLRFRLHPEALGFAERFKLGPEIR